jgi:hypothetical protein
MTNRPPESRDTGEATSSAVFVVDRRENKILVLVNDAGDTFEVDASRFPARCRIEGAVLRVPLGLDSAPVWNKAVRDRIEEKRRLSLLTERLERLRRKDPGGDVSL